MAKVHHLASEIGVIGWSCRLPGAPDVASFWRLLSEGQCAVSQIPEDRWSLERFGHPQRQTRGRSYTWAAGVVENVWDFDPGMFGISPREAEQLDPQQRLLLELTWEALEDAGVKPSSIAGTEVGVFVGGSSTDYANFRTGDPACADSHFATGNALSVLANRISYVFDLKGPSLTIDTACSSSLVALHHACEALRSRRIETAIVAGVNVLASPFSFISFSQASMLSPTGRSRAFSSDADGYVRAEGGVALVLTRATAEQLEDQHAHGIIVASDVNSDGRTTGIALPSSEAQERLIRKVYASAGVDPDQLLFLEAHGTGTPAGDPIEAGAIGRALGVRRSKPLLIGSVKTNIGHLEPAAGLAGLLKAMLALEHGVLPRSLHFAEPNPAIPFADLNLRVAAERADVGIGSTVRYAGVNSFGFGGTNAHAIVAPLRRAVGRPLKVPARRLAPLVITARSSRSLAAPAHRYAEALIDTNDAVADALVRSAAHQRERLPHRLVVTAETSRDMVETLSEWSRGNKPATAFVGVAAEQRLPIAFVYSGNGSQWVGMGRRAYRQSIDFRTKFDGVDALFTKLSGWSLAEAMLSDELDARLPRTSVAQPLIFAIQVAATKALAVAGVKPMAVLGHSVGEVAGAFAAGALDLKTAVRVIYYRSLRQELTAGSGDMIVVGCSAEAAAELASGIDGIEIAALNSARAVTLSGPVSALDAVKLKAGAQGISVVPLQLGYPFHSELMVPCRAPLMEDLKSLQACTESIPFISTVAGHAISGTQLNADYWWRNVREPVLFSAAVKEAADLGARFFVEIGPRGTLQRHIKSCVEGRDGSYVCTSVFDRGEERSAHDAAAAIAAQALVAGAIVSEEAIFGRPAPSSIKPPHYAWDRRTYRFEPSSEAVGYRVGTWHPLIGDRHVAGGLEWHSTLDTTLAPHLADHVVAGQPILPGSAFLEMALAAARQWLEATHVVIRELEIQKPLNLSSTEPREVMVRISPGSSTFEIASRPRLTGAAWLVHARGKIFGGNPDLATPRQDHPAKPIAEISGEELYALARGCGLNYGPAFRLVQRAVRTRTDEIDVELGGGTRDHAYLLDPMLMDACFHGLFVLFPELETTTRGVAYIPVRLEETAFHAAGSVPTRASIKLRRVGPRSILADFSVFGDHDELIAKITGARFVAVQGRRRPNLDNLAVVERLHPSRGEPPDVNGFGFDPYSIVSRLQTEDETASSAETTEDHLIIEGWATAAAYEIATGLADDDTIDLNALTHSGRLPASLRPWLVSVLNGLRSAGLLDGGPDRYRLFPDPLLPGSMDVIADLAASHPSRAPELFLGGSVSVFARTVVKERRISEAALERLATQSLEFYRVANRESHAAMAYLVQALRDLLTHATRQGPARILVVGESRIVEAWQSIADRETAQFTVLDERPHSGERHSGHAEFSVAADVDALPAAGFDLVLSAGGLARLEEGCLTAIRRVLAPRGLVLSIEPPPSLFRSLVLALHAVVGRGQDGDVFPMMRSAARWSGLLAAAGLEQVFATTVEAVGGWTFLTARAPEESASALPSSQGLATPLRLLLVEQGARSKLSEAIDDALAPRRVSIDNLCDPQTGGRLDLIVVLAQAKPGDDPAGAITARCLTLAKLAQTVQQSHGVARVWLIHRDALAQPDGGSTDPVEAASWTFCRTLANEYASVDFRRVDIDRRTRARRAAEQLRALIASDTPETELQITREGLRVVRVEAFDPGNRAAAGSAAAARLVRGTGPGQRLAWQAVERASPGQNEVEIAVEATGLNFRDLMWSMDLLPDDMLEDGFTGPTLGLECAGTIVRIGTGVTRVAIGDRVVAMAPQAFSSHVVTHEQMLAKIPEAMPAEAAATLPVAFLTAYYSLVTLANLDQGESVLIHGAAGAVGLAAIQIARERGATIIATAGSRAKRDMLRAMGIEHVLDSRSTSFTDKVHEITGEGVDVVLNSLAGEPMERSLHALRPFGRFVELGKRDYVANTHLGLRPFRRNLSYFGVDVDQLIAGNRAVGQRVFTNVMRLVRDHVLTPLPYSVFSGENIADAFQLMQQSGHVGKIVVRPPRLSHVAAHLPQPEIARNRTHLITGAFGGFGMETARWLAARGARNLVLVGRHGAASEEARALVDELKAMGVNVLAAQCDVSNATALEGLLRSVKATMPPLGGVLHAAMVLDDSLVANLDAAQLDRVLQPKVTGAAHLDRLTRGATLDYFVLFSSITTVIGNPGQASYVAANGYLEGLARKRRQDGLPGLAIAWGPISDVGVVARQEKLRKALMDRRGLSGLQVSEALDLFGDALARAAQDPSLAVITIAPRDWTKQASSLAILRSPTYSTIVRHEATNEEQDVETINLRDLLATEAPDAARRKIVSVIATRLGAVLHMRPEDIDQARPFAEMGIDSLMTFEFTSSLEKAFEMPIALTASFATLCVSNLADQIMAQAGRDRTGGSVANAIADKHMPNASAGEVAILKEVAARQDHRQRRLLQ